MSNFHVFRSNQQIAEELKRAVGTRIDELAYSETASILGLNLKQFLDFCSSLGASIEELSAGEDSIGLSIRKLRFNLSLGSQDRARVLSQGGAPLDPEGVATDDAQAVTPYNVEGTFAVRHDGFVFVLSVAAFRFLSPTNSNLIFAFHPPEKRDALDGLLNDFATERIRMDRETGGIRVWGSGEIEPSFRPDWDDIYLPEAQKREIRMQVETFLGNESLYRRLNIPYRRGFLLYGPPGNGKTLLIKVLASSYRSLKPVMVPLNRAVGERELSAAVQEAERLAPSLLILEDIDTMFSSASGISYSEFLNLIDGLSDLSRGVLIVATTNHPAKLGAALTERPGRFDRLWNLGKPNSETRHAYLLKLVESSEHALSDPSSLIESFVTKTDGYSMAYLRELYMLGSYHAIDEGKPLADTHLETAFDLLNEQRKAAERSFPEDKPSGFGFQANNMD